MEFQVGANVGGYDILDIISSSKAEVVYRVRNLQAKRIEVMRVLPLSVAGDQERTERFLREMRVHAKLSHPNILEFYGATELERRLVMTTEAVEGVTLAERLKLGPLPWKEAVALMQQALAGLAHAHAQGIVHRDVKPQNMLITPEGVVKLADFGLAKAATSPQVTQVGVVVGTLQYISPEQVRGTAKVDARSDLYSLGLVLYEAVVGKTPFDYTSQFEIMVAQVNETPKPPSALNREAPAQLDAVILKAVAKSPDERFQTADEFSAALETVKALIEKPAQAPAVAVAASEPPAAEPKVDAIPAPAVSTVQAPVVPTPAPLFAVQAASTPLDLQPELPPPAPDAPPAAVIDESAPVQAALRPSEVAAASIRDISPVELVPPLQMPDIPVPVNGRPALLAAVDAAALAAAASSLGMPGEPVMPAQASFAVPANGQAALLAAVEASEAMFAASPALVAEIAAAPVFAPAPESAAVPLNGQSALLAAVEASEAMFAASPALVAEIAAAPVSATAAESAAEVPVNGQSALLAAVEVSEAMLNAAAAPVPNIAAVPVTASPPEPAIVATAASEPESVTLALVSEAPVPVIPAPAAGIPVAAAEVPGTPPVVDDDTAPQAAALVSEPVAGSAAAGLDAAVGPVVAPEPVQEPAPPPVPATANVASAVPDPPRVQSPTTVQPIEDMAVLTADEQASKEDARRWDAGLLYLFAATVIMLVAAALTALLQTPQ